MYLRHGQSSCLISVICAGSPENTLFEHQFVHKFSSHICGFQIRPCFAPEPGRTTYGTKSKNSEAGRGGGTDERDPVRESAIAIDSTCIDAARLIKPVRPGNGVFIQNCRQMRGTAESRAVHRTAGMYYTLVEREWRFLVATIMSDGSV